MQLRKSKEKIYKKYLQRCSGITCVIELSSRELLKIKRKSTKKTWVFGFWLWYCSLFFKTDARLGWREASGKDPVIQK